MENLTGFFDTEANRKRVVAAVCYECGDILTPKNIWKNEDNVPLCKYCESEKREEEYQKLLDADLPF